MSKRDRYNDANIRGGMGVRKRLEEEAQRTTYRLNGVQTGAVIARTSDRFGRWGKEYPIDIGVLVRKTASTVYIRWASTIEDITTYDQGDARYSVDRGRWKVLGARRGDPLDVNDPLTRVLKKLRQEGFLPLTQRTGSGMIDDADASDSTTEEEEDMEMSNAAMEREAAKRALTNGDFKERETYTAKQVAGRCGTDAKTMRKFFRSSHSTVEPVGQGGRYEFAATDLPKIKKEFTAWSKRASERNTRKPKDETEVKRPKEKVDPAQKAEVLRQHDDPDITLEQLADAIDRANEEPSDEELAELEDLELDDLEDLDE